MKLGIQIKDLNATEPEKKKWNEYIQELNKDLAKKIEEKKWIKH